MAKYLFEAGYTASGAKGLISEGGSSRRKEIASVIESLGGKLESFYYAFGSTDVYAVGDLPDNVTAAAMSLAVNSSGLTTSKVVVLLTPEEMDAAAKKSINYRPPGA